MIVYALIEPIEYVDLGYGRTVIIRGRSENHLVDVAAMVRDATDTRISSALRRFPGAVVDGPAKVKLMLKFVAAMRRCGMNDDWDAQERISSDDFISLLLRKK